MSMHRNLASLAVAAALLSAPVLLSAQDAAKGKLASAKSLKCTFPLVATGTWAAGQPKADVKPSKLVLQFNAINTDEGTARLEGSVGGTYDIIVRYAGGYLHF